MPLLLAPIIRLIRAHRFTSLGLLVLMLAVGSRAFDARLSSLNSLETSPALAAWENRSQPTADANRSSNAAAHYVSTPTLLASSALQDDHPFPRRIPFNYEFPADSDWLNTNGRIRMQDLRGKFVILDFWTYCCINCMHILPELKKLEETYPNQLVVIGVHSAKFETEQEVENIRDAILRYEIQHPVVNDPQQRIWSDIGVNAWPTLILIDPAGDAVFYKAGETKAEVIQELIGGSIRYYRDRKLLDETPVRFELHEFTAESTPLRYPGKVLADPAGNRLFISDSNHNRIVITSMTGELLEIIGSGQEGREDGSYEEVQFDHPQGMALRDSDTLYVADTENHLIRKIDLVEKRVSTVSGTGSQADAPFPGLGNGRGPMVRERWFSRARTTPLASPWDLWIHDNYVYIAMAGPHQIWRMNFAETEMELYAGNGREDIVDGPRVPRSPYQEGFSAFAQPSGLSSDGTWLFVADSEGSSVRAIPLSGDEPVRTVVGTSRLPANRLFTFGDVDGNSNVARLQHCLGVAYHDGQIYVADTYNNKIRVVDAQSGEVQTFAGDGMPGSTDSPARFDEPAGINYADGKLYVADTNNHLIRVIDVATREVSTLEIPGLQPPTPPTPERPTFAGAEAVTARAVPVMATNDEVSIEVQLQLPAGWKINPLAPLKVYYLNERNPGVVKTEALPTEALVIDPPSSTFSLSVPVSGDGEGKVQIGFDFYYCQESSEGLCKIGSRRLTIPIEVGPNGGASGQVPLPIRP